MSDWKPEIVRLGKIEDLPNSDFLSITNVMDVYPCVIKKGQYKEGDLVSWLPYDSVCPDTEQFKFLCPKDKVNEDGTTPQKYRTLKAKRIRGTYSEGLIVDAVPGLKEGDSIVEHFSLEKRVYPEEIDQTGKMACEGGPSGVTLFKYDLEGVAKYGRYFNDNEYVIITEKLEGENCTYLYAEDRLWVRSRNFFKKDVEGSYWWELPRRLDLEEKLKKHPGLAIWGELYGGVKNFRYSDNEIKNNKVQRNFRVFDIYDTNKRKFLEWDDVVMISKELGLETVPVIYSGPWKVDKSLYELAEGKSVIGNCVREGFVVRSVPESWDAKLGRKILKLKGKGYKLAKG